MKCFHGVRAAVLSCVLVYAASLSVQAGTVTFDLGGSGRDNIQGWNYVVGTSRVGGFLNRRGRVVQTTYQYGNSWQQTRSDADGDVTLTITPDAFTSGAAGTTGTYTVGNTTVSGTYLGDNDRDATASVTQSSDGLGVMNNGRSLTDDSPFEVDGSSAGSFGTGWFDFLVLDFSREVTLDFVNFSQFDAQDRFRLIYDANGDGIVGGAGDFMSDAFGEGSGGQFSSFAGLSTSAIGIAAVNADSAWRLQQLGLSFGGTTPQPPTTTPPPTSPPPPAPVPLPAAGWMLIAGIGGLLAMRRRSA